MKKTKEIAFYDDGSEERRDFFTNDVVRTRILRNGIIEKESAHRIYNIGLYISVTNHQRLGLSRFYFSYKGKSISFMDENNKNPAKILSSISQTKALILLVILGNTNKVGISCISDEDNATAKEMLKSVAKKDYAITPKAMLLFDKVLTKLR